MNNATGWITVIGAVVAVITLWFAISDRREKSRAEKRRALALDPLLKGHSRLATHVLNTSPYSAVAPRLEVLARPGWILNEPIDLSDLEVVLVSSREHDRAAVEEARRSAGKLVFGDVSASYSDVLEERRPNIYNGVLYRLMDVEPSAGRLKLTCASGTYFDFLDTCEVLALEAQDRLDKSKPVLSGRYRRRLSDPFCFRNRVAGLGINTLTLRVEQHSSSFILHRRSAAMVAHNSNRLGISPAGEFAPAQAATDSNISYIDVWRNITREFAEEYLGHPDSQRSCRWVDYEKESPFAELEAARRSGELRVHVLGVVVDPLTWKPDLLTVATINAELFDKVFSSMVAFNEEGQLVTQQSGKGRFSLVFDAPTIQHYVAEPDTTPVAKTSLQLAWRHRSVLGLAKD